MERFNYKTLKKVLKEDASILQLLEFESYGYRMDQEEELEALKTKLDRGVGGE